MADNKPLVADVTWEDLPPPTGATYDWTAIASALKSRPGEWAKVFENDRASLAVAIRQGSVNALRPDLGFESRTRNNVRSPRRTCTLYMRWVDPSQKAK